MHLVYSVFYLHMYAFKTYISEQKVEGGCGRDSGGRRRFLRRRNQRRGDQGDDGEEGQGRRQR